MAFGTTTSAYEMDGVGAVPYSINNAANIISSLHDTAAYNSAWSADQARTQREWQEEQNAKAMAFSSKEAAKNRDWQQMMSNTAHQREIADLKAAGLNPVLSAMGGNGASVGSGATASGVTSAGAKGEADTSLNSALVNLLGSIYNRTTQLEAANINARTQEAVAEKYNATSEIVAQISAGANRYATDVNKYLHENYPSNIYQAIPAIVSAITQDSPSKSLNSGLSNFANGLKNLFDKASGSFGKGFSSSRP